MASKSKKAAVAKAKLNGATPDTPLLPSEGERIVWLPCPIYPQSGTSPQLEVGFNVGARHGIVSGRRAGDDQYLLRIIAATAPYWRGWDFIHPRTKEPLPAPDRTQPETYRAIYDLIPDLATWLNEGFAKALEGALGEDLGNAGGGN